MEIRHPIRYPIVHDGDIYRLLSARNGRELFLMRALSIRQPWAWLIVHSVKDVENRTWSTHHRGAFLVHSGLQLHGTREEREHIRAWVRRRFGVIVPEDLPLGGIVGQADLVRVVERSDSPWFTGPIGFVLEGARPLPFRRCLGRLGFFPVRLGAPRCPRNGVPGR
jgi:hypothetical protein